MMKFFVNALISICFLSANAMSQQQNTWSPMFDEIRMTRKENQTNINQDIMTFKFGQYWPPYPFRVNLDKATIELFPKIKGPNDPTGTLQWDQNWTGEVWVKDRELNEGQMELVATFNKNTQSIVIPRDKIFNLTQILIKIKGFLEGKELLYDQFGFTLSADTYNTPVDPGGGDGGGGGGVIIEVPCYTTSISPAHSIFNNSASTGSFTVNQSKIDCVWNISKNSSWITISGETTRTGNSTVSFAISANETEETRTGTITAGNQNFIVVQKGKPPTIPPPVEIPCYVSSLGESFKVFPQIGGSGSYGVSVNKTECSWTISKDASWITVSGSTSRTGNSTVSYTVSENTTNEVRVGRITTLNTVHVVVQPGKPSVVVETETPCYSTSQNSSFFVSSFEETTSSFSITTSKQDCSWTISKDSSWLSVSGNITRTGNSTITFLVSKNESNSVRVGSITAYNQKFTVVQLGKPAETPVKEPEIESVFVNVEDDDRPYSQVKLSTVLLNSKDPLVKEKDDSEIVIPPPSLGDHGYIMAWGRNNSFQYGNGIRGQSATPLITISESVWFFVDAGSGHAAAIDKNGDLFTWGNNTYGELGTGDSRQRSTPTKVNSSLKWRMVSCGKFHTIALLENGEIYSWGRNLYGQLGINSITNFNFPQRVAGKNDWVYVHASEDQSYAIDSSGKLYSWGYNNNGQLGIGIRSNARIPTLVSETLTWRTVSSGQFHALGITTEGELYAWGRNNYGQLGNGTTSFTPILSPVKLTESNDWKEISCGSGYSLAINNNGELYVWGQNNYGQLGFGQTTVQTTPRKAEVPKVKNAYAGFYHTFIITEDGDVYSCGRNQDGQLGIGSNFPASLNVFTKIEPLSKKTIQIACGDYFTLSINGVSEPPSGSSPNGSYIGVGSSAVELTDEQGMKWKVVDGVIKVNDENAGYSANVVILLWWDGKIYQSNQAGGWWRWDGNGIWTNLPEGDPRNTIGEIIQFQSVVFIPTGKEITISWLGVSLENSQVRVSLFLGNQELFVRTYSSNAEKTQSYVVNSEEYEEYTLKIELIGGNSVLQEYQTKFITKGF